MLGLNGVVVKSHGGTDAEGFAHAVDVAMDMVVHRFNDHIREDLTRIAELMALAAKNGASEKETGDWRAPRHRAIGTTMAIRSILAGVGAYLPERVVSNDELARTVETSDEWIRERTGIRQRHIAAPHETAAFMGTAAARAALADAGAEPAEVDAIILATSTPDQAFPATALRVQAALGVTRRLRLRHRRRLRRLHLRAVGRRQHDPHRPGARRAGDRQRGLLAHPELAGPRHLRAVRRRRRRGVPARRQGQRPASTAAFSPPTCMPRARSATSCMSMARWGGATSPGHLVMNGREVFRHAVIRLAEAVEEALAANGLTQRDIDWLVPHQANLRIIDAMGRKLGLPPERVVVTVDRHANTSAASVPLALAEALPGRTHPQRRPGADGGTGRRPDLGFGAGAHVTAARSLPMRCLATS